MATFTNVSGVDLDLPSLGVFAAAGESFDVPDDEADGLRQQPAFAEVTKKKATPATDPATPATDPADAAVTEGAI